MTSPSKPCVDCGTSSVEFQRCPTCQAQLAKDVIPCCHGAAEAKDVSSSIWHGLAAWTLLAEIMIIGGILLILAVRGCS
jgi:hypothetical protein